MIDSSPVSFCCLQHRLDSVISDLRIGTVIPLVILEELYQAVDKFRDSLDDFTITSVSEKDLSALELRIHKVVEKILTTPAVERSIGEEGKVRENYFTREGVSLLSDEEYKEQLMGIAISRAFIASRKAGNNGEDTQLIGKVCCPLVHYIEKYGSDNRDILLGLQAVATHYKMIPIKRDGHCLFRSLAYGLILKLGNSADPKKALDRLRVALPLRCEMLIEMGHPTLSPALVKTLCEVEDCLEVLAQNFSVGALNFLFQDSRVSNSWVAFLRNLSCAYNVYYYAAPSHIFYSYAVERFGSVKEYLFKMTHMPFATEGDHVELDTLCTILGLELDLLNITAIGASDKKFSPNTDITKLSLLFIAGHYDVVVKK